MRDAQFAECSGRVGQVTGALRRNRGKAGSKGNVKVCKHTQSIMHVATIVTLISILASVCGDIQPNVLGIGMSGSGLFAVYHLGVLETLIDSGVIIPGTTVMAGASGGAILSLHTCLGLTPRHTFDRLHVMLQSCAASPTTCPLADLHAFGARIMDAMLLTAPHSWERCIGRAHVHVALVQDAPALATDASCPLNLRKQGWTLTNFTSRQDVVEAAAATSYIPGIVGDACATTLRGQAVIDGGYFDHLPCPPGTEHGCLRINAFPMEESDLEEFHGVDALPFPPPGVSIDIYPGMRGEHTLPPIPVGTWSTKLIMDPVGIAPHAVALFELGREDAAAWVASHWAGAAEAATCAAEQR